MSTDNVLDDEDIILKVPQQHADSKEEKLVEELCRLRFEIAERCAKLNEQNRPDEARNVAKIWRRVKNMLEEYGK